MKFEQCIRRTKSVCPVCLRRIDAQIVEREDGVYLKKHCTCGDFETRVWKGSGYREWDRQSVNERPRTVLAKSEKGCPFDCGVCEAHMQQGCCVLIEVTARCDQHCPYCFAGAGTVQEDPSFEEVCQWLQFVRNIGEEERPFNIQLSGGEPCMRDDLPRIVKYAKKLGFPYIQLNTNGKRLSYDQPFLKALANAGLSSVFLQFDGTSDAIYEKLRSEALFADKKRAIANCGEAGLGIALVPVIVPGVNDGHVGEILRFAVSHMPTVRGVHFQPVSYFGRYPQENQPHFTMPEMINAISEQTGGMFPKEAFTSLATGNPYCSFRAAFQVKEGRVEPVQEQNTCCCTPGIFKSRDYIKNKWTRASEPGDEWESCVKEIKDASFTVSCMCFQDAMNLDLDRLKKCSVHVLDAKRRKIVPFCAYNLTAKDGRPLYR